MKKLIAVIMTLTFLLGGSLLVLAQGTPTNAIEKQQFDKAQEKALVLEAMNANQSHTKQFFINHRKSFKGLNISENDISFGVPYKVYVPGSDFILAFMADKPIASLLEKANYFWEVPVLYKGQAIDSFTVEFYENKWQIGEMGSHNSKDSIGIASQPESIIKLASSNNISNVDTFIHFRVLPLHSDYLYVAGDKGEFLYPLIHGRSRLYGLDSQTLYSRQQVADKIIPVLKKIIRDIE